jgi:hypothetical protein
MELVKWLLSKMNPHPIHNHAVAEFHNPFAIEHGATQLHAL